MKIRRLPLNELSGSELKWLVRHRCKHYKPLVVHYGCFKHKNYIEERVGFIDIETEDLNADFGVIFSYYIKVKGKNKFYFDYLRPTDIKRNHEALDDKRLLKNLIRDLKNFDRVVGHYSSRFDLNFIRTRAVMCGLNFPKYGVYVQTDTWRILRMKFKLSRNSLENATRKLLGATNKTYLSLPVKHGVLRGEKWAIDYTLDHNKKDVISTELLWNKIHEFARQTKSSI